MAMPGVMRVCGSALVVILTSYHVCHTHSSKDTHAMAARKDEENQKLRRALGIEADHTEGKSTHSVSMTIIITSSTSPLSA